MGGMTQTVSKEQAVKSRDRVKAYGEVFTPRHMVDWMVDFVCEKMGVDQALIDKTFLEPAAGTGNFLVAILERKLGAVENLFPREEWAKESLFGLASIYGIELLEDNHQEAKEAMLADFVAFHEKHDIPCGPDTDLHRAATFLIEENIACGNFLTGLDSRGKEIEFSWWKRIPESPGMVQREPFTLNSLRGDGFDFTVYEGYGPCQIDRVHVDGEVDG